MIGKRKLKAVELVSVFIEVMREYMEPDQQGEFFFDHAPGHVGQRGSKIVRHDGGD